MLTLSKRERLAALEELAKLRRLALQRWWDDPVQFVDDVVRFKPGDSLADYQRDELTQLAQQRRVAVRGPRGSGKTMPAALAIWWFACTRELAGADWKIPMTAGSWPQISVYLWPEVRKWHGMIDWVKVGLPKPRVGMELLTNQLKLTHGEAFGRAATDPQLIEGAHADNILVIIDEGKSVADGIWDAIEGFFSNPGDHYTFALSTPGAATGRFYDICTSQPGYEDWSAIHVTIDEAVEAGRVSPVWVSQREAQWGVESRMFRCHVLAEFAGEEDGVIPMAWIEAAVERGRDVTATTPTRVGVDVSDTGSDETVIAYCTEAGCYKVEELHAPDVVTLASMVATRVGPKTTVVIDAIGIGAGTLAQARKENLKAVGFVASAGTKRRDITGTFGFVSTRAAGWWNLRELLDPANGHDMILPDDPKVLGDLAAPKWREVSGGRISIESKDEIRKRLGRSTDTGDAIMMAMWRDTTEMPGGWAGNLTV